MCKNNPENLIKDRKVIRKIIYYDNNELLKKDLQIFQY